MKTTTWTIATTLLVGCPSSDTDDSASDTASHEEQGEPELCDDGEDNDLDGLSDCEDSDCMEVCLEDCSNEVDDDADT